MIEYVPMTLESYTCSMYISRGVVNNYSWEVDTTSPIKENKICNPSHAAVPFTLFHIPPPPRLK